MSSSPPIAQFAVLAVSVLGLWIGARALVDATVRLARRFGVSELTIGLTIVAMGTSTPELVVTVDAALAGLGEIGVGNVVGSNIYNLAFILGAVSLLRVIPVERSLVHRDGVALVLSTVVAFGVLFDRTVTGLEGVLLAGLFAAYTAYLVRDEQSAHSIETEYPDSRVTGAITEAVPSGLSARGRDALLLVGGLGIVLISGHYMVEAASTLARGVGISDWVIGGTIVAAGTSTPELAVSLVAMRQGHVGMSVGNVVGSNVFNVLGILGIAAVIRPLAVGGAAIESLLWLLVITVLMVGALWSGRRLSRPEGGLFVLSELARWALGLLRIFG
ncbi:Na+/Ca+ antiporter, CaCA family protein [Halorubrum aidingense JCM 13560]|uniref:Na+/Ca+ antiporter, CaCA family protein n=1 Tax=Halorubrum aidingense JCM 13560 TaxID=1230454 RepID=M0PBU4_9EURY|nr:calcium/sodium antiporter [Halorubrum aidingense]EMA67632.1 Na+/Ca+ antiporter, CaCA family protein [Halorubrum aidingense JCM 13560]